MESYRAMLVIIAAMIIIFTAMVSTSDFFHDDFESIEVVNDNETFVIGINPNAPPLTYKNDNSQFIGFDMELVQEVCNRNQWKLVKKPIVWNQKLDVINSEKIDCLWGGFTINGRENNYTLTRPYFNNTQVVVVKSDSGINSTSDLSGKVVEVLNGSSAEVFLKNNMTNLSDTFYRLISMMSFRQDFDDLESGVADAVILDRIVAIYMINEYGSDKYKILDDEICFEQFGIAFKKGNTDLRDRVQETLDEMFADGTVKRIAEKYKDYGIPENLIYP